MNRDRSTPRDRYRELHGVGLRSLSSFSRRSGPKAAEKATPAPPSLTHVGGGVYELPNGERVKGRAAAEAKLAERG